MIEGNTLTALLASFFYQYSYLSIPGLGRFQLSGDVMPHPGEHHGKVFPKGSIVFTYNIHEEVDPGLIDFITSRTRKMKALALSDVRSVGEAAKEMLNLGQSYTFTGIATLVPRVQADLEVVPDNMPANLTVDKTVSPDMFQSDRPVPFNEGQIHSSGGRRSVGGVIIVGICLVLVALLVYFLFFHNRYSPEQSLSVNERNTVQDRPAGDTASGTVPVRQDGLLHYEVVFEQATRERAFKRYRQLTGWGHPVILRTRDSVQFTLAVPVATPAADTPAVKDSIRALYGHPVYIRYLPH